MSQANSKVVGLGISKLTRYSSWLFKLAFLCTSQENNNNATSIFWLVKQNGPELDRFREPLASPTEIRLRSSDKVFGTLFQKLSLIFVTWFLLLLAWETVNGSFRIWSYFFLLRMMQWQFIISVVLVFEYSLFPLQKLLRT